MLKTLIDAFWPTVGILILLASLVITAVLICLANAARRGPEVTSAEDGQRDITPQNEAVNCPCQFHPIVPPAGKSMQQYFHVRLSARKGGQ